MKYLGFLLLFISFLLPSHSFAAVPAKAFVGSQVRVEYEPTEDDCLYERTGELSLDWVELEPEEIVSWDACEGQIFFILPETSGTRLDVRIVFESGVIYELGELERLRQPIMYTEDLGQVSPGEEIRLVTKYLGETHYPTTLYVGEQEINTVSTWRDDYLAFALPNELTGEETIRVRRYDPDAGFSEFQEVMFSLKGEEVVEELADRVPSEDESSVDEMVEEEIVEKPEAIEIMENGELVDRLLGRILLQVERRGELWFLNPADRLRYYVSTSEVAYELMSSLGLGIRNHDLETIPTVDTPEELLASESVCGESPLAQRVSGRILLQVENMGEAWYVSPHTCRRIYLQDGPHAFSVLSALSLGVQDSHLNQIKLAK